MLLFGARIRCFAEGMFPFKAQRAAWGRAATKSPELSSARAAAAAENRISGFRSPTVPSPQRGCPLRLPQAAARRFAPAAPPCHGVVCLSVCPRCGISPAQPSGADAAESAPSPRGSSTLQVQQLYPFQFYLFRYSGADRRGDSVTNFRVRWRLNLHNPLPPASSAVSPKAFATASPVSF